MGCAGRGFDCAAGSQPNPLLTSQTAAPLTLTPDGNVLFCLHLSYAPPRHGEALISALTLNTFDGYDSHATTNVIPQAPASIS